MDLPVYQSHKQVRALKLQSVSGTLITFVDERYPPISVDAGMYARYTPTAGDYYVVYPDGYTSFSPCKAFEEGYTLVSPRRAAVPFDADESNKIGQANALRDQAGFMLSEFLVALVLFALCTVAFAKGNPAALAKYRAEKAAAAGKAPAAGKGYTVPSAGKWSKPAGAAAPVVNK